MQQRVFIPRPYESLDSSEYGQAGGATVPLSQASSMSANRRQLPAGWEFMMMKPADSQQAQLQLQLQQQYQLQLAQRGHRQLVRKSGSNSQEPGSRKNKKNRVSASLDTVALASMIYTGEGISGISTASQKSSQGSSPMSMKISSPVFNSQATISLDQLRKQYNKLAIKFPSNNHSSISHNNNSNAGTIPNTAGSPAQDIPNTIPHPRRDKEKKNKVDIESMQYRLLNDGVKGNGGISSQSSRNQKQQSSSQVVKQSERLGFVKAAPANEMSPKLLINLNSEMRTFTLNPNDKDDVDYRTISSSAASMNSSESKLSNEYHYQQQLIMQQLQQQQQQLQHQQQQQNSARSGMQQNRIRNVNINDEASQSMTGRNLDAYLQRTPLDQLNNSNIQLLEMKSGKENVQENLFVRPSLITTNNKMNDLNAMKIQKLQASSPTFSTCKVDATTASVFPSTSASFSNRVLDNYEKSIKSILSQRLNRNSHNGMVNETSTNSLHSFHSLKNPQLVSSQQQSSQQTTKQSIGLMNLQVPKKTQKEKYYNYAVLEALQNNRQGFERVNNHSASNNNSETVVRRDRNAESGSCQIGAMREERSYEAAKRQGRYESIQQDKLPSYQAQKLSVLQNVAGGITQQHNTIHVPNLRVPPVGNIPIDFDSNSEQFSGLSSNPLRKLKKKKATALTVISSSATVESSSSDLLSQQQQQQQALNGLKPQIARRNQQQMPLSVNSNSKEAEMLMKIKHAFMNFKLNHETLIQSEQKNSNEKGRKAQSGIGSTQQKRNLACTKAGLNILHRMFSRKFNALFFIGLMKATHTLID